MSLLALAVFVVWSAPADAANPPAQAAKKAKKKCKKKKCKKKKKAAPQVPSTPPAGGGPTNPPPPPPDLRTTDQKIDDAVASGAITAEEGLTYKVFAAFRDPRLPGQYVGVPDHLTEAPLDEVTAQWEQLSDGAKATLGPFLIPPMHDGSYWEEQIQATTSSAMPDTARASPRTGVVDQNSPWCIGNPSVELQDWHYVEAASGPAAGKVRIWYQDRYALTDAALAADFLSAMENKIWPALTTLMQREPLPDEGSTAFCSGGSDALDIALVDADKPTTYSNSLSNENTSSHMIFPRSGWTKPLLAHEFMHMIQLSYTLSSGDLASAENQWLKEGTAQWAQDYVSSSQYGIGLTPNQTEHDAIQNFLPIPEKSLDSPPKGHYYGTYLFWLWAARKGNDPGVVRQVWNATATQKSLNAAKSIFGSGWAQAWKDFTRTNWNQDPVGDYQDWDDIHDTPALAADGALPNSFTAFNVFVPPVAAKYLTFTPDAAVNVLTYRNVGPLSDDVGVQAILTYKDGSHATEDWSQIAQQDVPMCNIEKLTLVLSNASVTPTDNKLIPITWTPPSSGTGPRAGVGPRAANVCVPDPQGSFSGTGHYDDGFGTTLDYSWSGTVDFDPFGPINPWFFEYSTEVWDSATVTSGSVTLSGSGVSIGSTETCTIDIPSATYQFGQGDGTMAIQPGPEPHYGIQLGFPANQLPDATISCPDDDPYTTPFTPPGHLIYTADPEQASVRGTYAGSATLGSPNYSENYTWNLVDPLAP